MFGTDYVIITRNGLW